MRLLVKRILWKLGLINHPPLGAVIKHFTTKERTLDMWEHAESFTHDDPPTSSTILPAKMGYHRTYPSPPITDGVRAARYFGAIFGTKDQRDIAVRLMNARQMREPYQR